MSVAVGTITADAYLATSESLPGRNELIDGTVVVNEPHLPHMRAQQQVHFALMAWVRAAPGRGEVGLPADVRVDEVNVFAPDVWWVPEQRRPAPDALLLDGLPDLVVEVRSPSTWARDVSVKLPAYEAGGVAEAWFVDTDAYAVLVFRRSRADVDRFDVRTELRGDDVLASPMLDDFALAVRSIFEQWR